MLLKFLSVKEVPTLFWSAPKALTFKPPLTSFIFLVVGLFIFGVGEALIVAAAVGVSPWTVLAQGVAQSTGWELGFTTFVVSMAVLVCWIPLRQSPGIGTILNAVIIALVFSFLLPYLPTFDSVLLRVIEAIVGILITGFGGALYLIANLGPGPRDGLMTGLQGVTNLPIAWVRSGIELSVIAIGWLLGGNVGFGTVMFAFGIGPAIAMSMYFLVVLFGASEEKTGA
ncbi:membrane protein [Maritalea porphyrae]|uniref:Membrane protein n=2 Tax=Maritalea porphyrae TaxID=880732 RepID=A0ABQ5UKR4_9HYPH|nr:membrane protein [Maritalea porphyrae]